MEKIIFQRTTELKKNLKDLKEKLKVNLNLKGKILSIKGNSMDEYEAQLVLDALNFGFSAKKALLVKEPDIIFRKVNIKEFTRKKNLKEVRARIIGKKGQTLRILSEISNTQIILNERENRVGIIGDAESIEITITAMINLIRGTKQSHIYRYLEKSNKIKKEESLGLK